MISPRRFRASRLILIRSMYAYIPVVKYILMYRYIGYTGRVKKKKNEAAVALGKLRAKTLTNEVRSRGGQKGGKSRAERLSPKRRKEIAQKAAKTRWAKRGKES